MSNKGYSSLSNMGMEPNEPPSYSELDSQGENVLFEVEEARRPLRELSHNIGDATNAFSIGMMNLNPDGTTAPKRKNSSFSKPEAQYYEMGHPNNSNIQDDDVFADNDEDADDDIVYSRGDSHINFNQIPSEKVKGQKLLYLTSVFVSMGVFVFGYDQGVLSGIITEKSFLQFFDEPTRLQIGTMVAILEIGALLASLSVGYISDRIGRKRTIILGAFIFVVGGTIQTLSPNLNIMCLGRIISGLGVGILSTIIPLFQSEISPSEQRGKLAGIEFTGNIFGYSTSVWVDYVCSFLNGIVSWRVPLFAQVVLGSFLLIGGFFIVESPRWLLDKEKDQEAYHVLSLLYFDSPEPNKAKNEYNSIKYTITEERYKTPPHLRTYRELFKNHKYRVMIASTALAWAQFNGINLISYYAPMVFEQAGFEGRSALLVTGVNSLIYLASTVPFWFLVDSWGRRPIFIYGAIGMAIPLFLISGFIFLDKSYTPAAVAVMVIIYNAMFGVSWGPVAWLYANEVYSNSVRAKGSSVAAATNWLANFIVGEGSPVLLELITWRLYFIHGFICCLSGFFAYKFYPETSGVELEDMDRLFAGEDVSSK